MKTSPCLVLTVALADRCCLYPHFTDEEAEAHGGQMTFPGPIQLGSVKGQSQAQIFPIAKSVK